MKVMMCIVILLGVFLLTGGPGLAIVEASSSFLLLSDTDPALQKKACHDDRSHSKIRVVCDGLEYDQLPTKLRSDVEILYFTHNRMDELTNDTLKKFSDLAYISFRDNFILNIDSGAFETQEKKLISLDLTQNGLLTFPMNILEYPELKYLFLGKNRLTDASFNYTIDSGIELLELNKNKLTKLPVSLSLTKLEILNVTHNKINKIKADELAHFCSLKKLDISENPLNFDDACECQALKKWIELRQIKITPNNIKCKECTTNSSILNNSNKIYDECLNAKISRERTIQAWYIFKVSISFGIIILIIVLIVLFCIYKKRNKKGENAKINKELALSTNGATTELLNNGIKNQCDDA